MIRASSIKITAAMLLLLMVLFFAVVSWCFFTERGARISLGTLQNSLPNLQYQYESGDLANGLVLSNISWTMKNNTRISADQAALRWNPMCWRGQEFCLKNAEINQLTIALVKPKVKTNPIRLKPVNLPFALIADKLSIDRLTVERPEKKSIHINNLDFSGRLTEHTLTADALHLQWLNFKLQAEGRMELHENYPLKLTGQVSPADSQQKLPVKSRFVLNGDLLNARLNSTISQPFNSTITGKLSVLTRKFPIDLNLQWQQTQLPFKSEKPVFYLTNGDLQLSGFWPDYDITGSTETSGPKLPVAMTKLDGNINLKRLNFNQLHLTTLNGDITASGNLTFGQGLEWQSVVQVNNIEPDKFWSMPKTLTNGTLVVNGRTNNGLTTIQADELNLQGTTGGFPFTLTGDIHRMADKSLQLHTVEVSNRSNTLTANGTVGDNSDASVFFSLREPGMFHPDLKGDLHGDLKLTGSMQSPQLIGSASSGTLWFKTLRVTNSRVTGKLRANSDEVSELKIAAQSATSGAHNVRDLVVTLKGSPENHYLQAQFNGDPVSVSSVRMSGKVDEYNNWIGKIYKTSAAIAEQPVELDTPLELTWVQGRRAIAMQPHCWTVQESSVCIERPALLGKDGTLDFSVNRFDLATLNAFTPETMAAEGILQSKGVFKWNEFKRPQAEVSTNIIGGKITVQPPAATSPVTFDLSTADMQITTRRDKILSTLNVNTDKTGAIAADIEIGLNKRSYPLSGSVTLADSPIPWLSEHFPAIAFNKGTVSSSFNLGGTLKAPLIDGRISLSDAAIDSPKIPTPLDNIQMQVTVTNDNIGVNGSADSNGRPLTVDGSAVLENSDWTANLNLQAEQLNVRHKYLDRAVVSPDLKIRLTKDNVSVSGRIRVPRASVNIPKLDNTGIPISDDIVIVDAVAKNDLTLNQRSTHPVRADIDMQLGNRVSFTGYGIDADLHGNVNVKIKPKRIPELLGEILIDRGTYRSYGQSLVVRDGRINFVGPLDQTSLSVEAVRDTGRVLAGLRVNGSLSAPQTSLFSEPPLPDEAILPYLVLGRPIDLGAAGADDSQLIANAALFMGITNGRSLTQSLASNLGIDEFNVSATGTGDDTQVQLSGRLNDRLLVRYGLGVFNSVNTLFLRYDLAEKLYLETTQGLEKAVDLFYSFEFD
jgi:translocation and assembly module TamB